MQYTKGSIGRVFVLKFEDSDILLDKLSQFIKKERLKTAVMVFIGALKEGLLVTGPKKPVIPPEANEVNFMLLKHVPIDPTDDRYHITGGNGLAVMHIMKMNGVSVTIHFRSDPDDPKHMILFNPIYMPIHKRRQIVRSLKKSGMLSVDIADLLGVTKSVITSDIKQIEISQEDKEIGEAFDRIR